jgi:hypothetical protein
MAAEQTPEQVMDEALDAVRAALQTDARSWAAQVRTTARLADAARAVGGADRAFVELEVAGSWSVGQATATRWLVEAEQLTTSLPQTLAALEAGELLVHQARVLLHVTRACDPGIARRVEAEVLATDGVAGLCPADRGRWRRGCCCGWSPRPSGPTWQSSGTPTRPPCAAPGAGRTVTGWGWPGRC